MNGASQRTTIMAKTSATKVKYCGLHPSRKVYARKMCAGCYMSWYQQRRKAILAKLNPAKRSKIRHASDQRTLLNIVYKILCAELKPIHTKCEAQLSGCLGISDQIHHKKGRRGIMLIMSTYFGYLCDSCHKHCTKHSREAVDKGLSLPINSQTDYIFTPREIELIKKYNIRTPKSVYI